MKPDPLADGAAALRAEALSLGYGADRLVITELNLDLPAGAVSAIIGANGCGKSTLLRALARLLAPTSGAVLLDWQRLARLPTRSVARMLGLLPQGPVTPAGITVSALVRRDRMPHATVFRQWSAGDQQALDHALKVTGLDDLAEHQVDALSGGAAATAVARPRGRAGHPPGAARRTSRRSCWSSGRWSEASAATATSTTSLRTSATR